MDIYSRPKYHTHHTEQYMSIVPHSAVDVYPFVSPDCCLAICMLIKNGFAISIICRSCFHPTVRPSGDLLNPSSCVPGIYKQSAIRIFALVWFDFQMKDRHTSWPREFFLTILLNCTLSQNCIYEPPELDQEEDHPVKFNIYLKLS